MVKMARRLLAFALAFAVIGVPVAGDICEAACARHADHASRNETASHNTHHHHVATAASQPVHHHESIGSASSATVIPAPHVCHHVDAVLTESRDAVRGSVANAMAATAALITVLGPVSASTDIDSRHGPPVPVRAVAPLRI